MARKINAMGYKMTKNGHCNFGAPQLKNFLKKVLVGKKQMYSGQEKKLLYQALLSLQKWKNVFFSESNPQFFFHF